MPPEEWVPILGLSVKSPDLAFSVTVNWPFKERGWSAPPAPAVRSWPLHSSCQSSRPTPNLAERNVLGLSCPLLASTGMAPQLVRWSEVQREGWDQGQGLPGPPAWNCSRRQRPLQPHCPVGITIRPSWFRWALPRKDANPCPQCLVEEKNQDLHRYPALRFLTRDGRRGVLSRVRTLRT